MLVSEAARGEVAPKKKRVLTAAQKERKRETNKRWREDNPGRHKENWKRWYGVNQERHRKKCARWHLANPVRTLAASAIGRERKKHGFATLTIDGLVDSLRPFPAYCPLCGDKLIYGGGYGTSLPSSASIDQIIPCAGYGNRNARIIAYRMNCALGNATSEELRIAYEDRLRTEQLILQSANDLGPAL